MTDSQARCAPNATFGFIDAKVKGAQYRTLSWLKGKALEEQENLINSFRKKGKNSERRFI